MHRLITELRIVGIAEGTSFLLLLFIAMPLKYFADMPIAVRITGSLHGFLFILYVIAMIRAGRKFNWPLRKSIEVFVAAIYPFGTFILDKKLKEEEKELKSQQNLSPSPLTRNF